MRSTAVKLIIEENIIQFFYFPIWWYTKGAVQAIKRFVTRLQGSIKSLAIDVWIVNWFKPMYAQYDWQGRIISFFIRTVQIIARIFFLIVLFFFYLLLLIMWFVLPIFVVWQIFFHIS